MRRDAPGVMSTIGRASSLLDDYDPVTNTGTMQLVQQAAHRGIPHVGGVSQYQEITGLKYIFKTW
ncbi:HNH endonuclease [Brenneria rubrifaciens]|uniref:Uncharacterized protein n=1 Tax=Brenneria rubrifaciens TaxID=55213 RepID=A0A4P8QWG1_9GAMM|nr:hypothetical protein EH207_15755 [Brenneria rubrifaciens]